MKEKEEKAARHFVTIRISEEQHSEIEEALAAFATPLGPPNKQQVFAQIIELGLGKFRTKFAERLEAARAKPRKKKPKEDAAGEPSPDEAA